jgi:DNA-binding transcriptional regulator YhcF (GntR family)
MRFWITRNGEVPLKEQLVRQVVLGILSQDLPPGSRLPSVRAMARRHRIHANTVSSAWHDLLEQGWLELRRGSGLYVRSRTAASLHALLQETLGAARGLGYAPEAVLGHMAALVRQRPYSRILIAEPDAAMREILAAEIQEATGLAVGAWENAEAPPVSLIVALTTRVARLPPGSVCIPLKLRSVDSALGQPEHAPPGFLISVVSRSEEIRDSARAMLVAIGVGPNAIQTVDAGETGWDERLGLSSMVVTDVVTARRLRAGVRVRVFRVIADSSITEVRQLCGL